MKCKKFYIVFCIILWQYNRVGYPQVKTFVYQLSTINNCFYADKKEQVFTNKLCQLFKQLNNLTCIEFNTI